CVSFFCVVQLLPRPTLFPYTTLFRSRHARRVAGNRLDPSARSAQDAGAAVDVRHDRWVPVAVQPRSAERSAGSGRTEGHGAARSDRKSTRLNSSHVKISYAVFCLKKK